MQGQQCTLVLWTWPRHSIVLTMPSSSTAFQLRESAISIKAFVFSELSEESQRLHYCQPVQIFFPEHFIWGPARISSRSSSFHRLQATETYLEKSFCAVFADDTLLFDRCSGTSDAEHCGRLQEDIPRLDAWAGDWCTTFNPSKSAHMLLNGNNRQKSSHPHPTLSLSGGTIPSVP